MMTAPSREEALSLRKACRYIWIQSYLITAQADRERGRERQNVSHLVPHRVGPTDPLWDVWMIHVRGMLPVLVLEQVCQEGREKKRSKGENGACLASIKQTDLITGSLASRLGSYIGF